MSRWSDEAARPLWGDSIRIFPSEPFHRWVVPCLRAWTWKEKWYPVDEGSSSLFEPLGFTRHVGSAMFEKESLSCHHSTMVYLSKTPTQSKFYDRGNFWDRAFSFCLAPLWQVVFVLWDGREWDGWGRSFDGDRDLCVLTPFFQTREEGNWPSGASAAAAGRGAVAPLKDCPHPHCTKAAEKPQGDWSATVSDL